METVVISSNKFNFELLLARRNILKQGNIFYSPFSIASSLGTLCEGAHDTTKEELKNVLFIQDSDTIHDGFHAIFDSIQGLPEGIVLHISNILAADKSYEILPEFADNLKENYNVDTMLLDFQNNPEEAQKELYQNIETRTQKRINNLFAQDAITNDTRLISANAIYFKGTWVNPFQVNVTKKRVFHTIENKTVMVDMMYRRGKYKYTYNNQLKAGFLEIPYSGRTLSMIVILPKEKYGLSFLENNITINKLNYSIPKMKARKTNLSFPRFKLEESLPLKECLSEMGMQEVFTQDADFSGIIDKNKLSISDVFHTACVEVTEEGIEATAATRSKMKILRAIHNFNFTVDHPFMFFIREEASGLILFTGSIHTL